MNNLVYLSFGQGPYVDELVYSVLSALYKLGRERNNSRIIVYTDDPAALGELPVHIEPLTAIVDEVAATGEKQKGKSIKRPV